MKINKRIAIFIAGSAVLTFLIGITLLSALFFSGTENTENADAIHSAEVFDYVISENLIFLEKMLFDWAVWDMSYDFINSPFPEYVNSNLVDETFINLGLNAVIFLNNSREIIYERFYDINSGTDMNLSDKTISQINSYIRMIGNETAIKGVYFIGGKLALVTANRVYSSDKLRETNGFIIFARFLSEEDLAQLKKYIGSTVFIEDTQIPIGKQKFEGIVRINDRIYKRYVNSTTIEALIQISDADDNPSGILHVYTERERFLAASNPLLVLGITQLLGTLAVSLCFFWLVKKFIINKINNMDSEISSIIQREKENDGMLDLEISIKADEEIRNLCANFNALTSIINKSRKELIDKNFQMNQQVAAMEASIMGIAILNKEEEYIYLNHTHATMYGFESPGKLIGKQWRVLYYPNELERFEKEIMPVFYNRGYFHGEAVGKKTDGSRFEQEVYLTALQDGSIVWIVQDITLRKDEERVLISQKEELEKAYEQLQQLNEMKDNFLSSISHELKTPLTSIQSYNQLIHEGILGEINEKQKEALGISLESVKSLNSMITNILDASKYESGMVQVCSAKIRFCELLNNVMREFEPMLNNINAKVIYEIKEGFVIYADYDLMVRVLRNLISNSIKYRSERQLEIKIKASTETGRVIISYLDNGSGISKKNQGQLFNKFFQADQGSGRKVEGTGLGLSIVKAIVELHNGSITAKSEESKWTEFIIVLPDNMNKPMQNNASVLKSQLSTKTRKAK